MQRKKLRRLPLGWRLSEDVYLDNGIASRLQTIGSHVDISRNSRKAKRSKNENRRFK